MTDTTKQIEQERAAFEAWAQKNFMCLQRADGGKMHYISHDTRNAWLAWQESAARATPVSPAPDLHSAGTIDTPEFRHLLGRHVQGRMDCNEALKNSDSDLIAHIDARIAAAQLEGHAKGWAEAYKATFARKEAIEAAAREQALEEAAKVCETQLDPTRSWTTSAHAYWHAKAIRALKASPASVGAQVAPDGAVAGEPVHQWRRRIEGQPWHDAPQDEAYARIDDAYEARTLYTAPVPAPATVDRDAVLDEVAKHFYDMHKENWNISAMDEVMKLKGKAAPVPVAVANAPVAGLDKLHSAIMNLPCKPVGYVNCPTSHAQGHRDARHAAAELVSALQAERQPQPAAAAVPDETLRKLAFRTLWLAYVWNDHNFDAAHLEARKTCEEVGIKSFDDANAWLAAPVAVAPVAGEGLTDERIREIFAGIDCPTWDEALLNFAHALLAEQPQPAAQAAVPEDVKQAVVSLVESRGLFAGIGLKGIRLFSAELGDVLAQQWPGTPDLKAMVNRFLGWKLPETFSPDCGISFKPLGHLNLWPVGTNLLNADEARQMFEYCLATQAERQPQPAAQPSAEQGNAARDVLAERRRQVEVEGWTPEHDDMHGDGQMAVAAGYYALACGYPHERDIGGGHRPAYWPWASSWWKPRGKRSNLVRAGALILAEIERLDRAAAPAAVPQGVEQSQQAGKEGA